MRKKKCRQNRSNIKHATSENNVACRSQGKGTIIRTIKFAFFCHILGCLRKTQWTGILYITDLHRFLYVLEYHDSPFVLWQVQETAPNLKNTVSFLPELDLVKVSVVGTEEHIKSGWQKMLDQFGYTVTG